MPYDKITFKANQRVAASCLNQLQKNALTYLWGHKHNYVEAPFVQSEEISTGGYDLNSLNLTLKDHVNDALQHSVPYQTTFTDSSNMGVIECSDWVYNGVYWETQVYLDRPHSESYNVNFQPVYNGTYNDFYTALTDSYGNSYTLENVCPLNDNLLKFDTFAYDLQPNSFRVRLFALGKGTHLQPVPYNENFYRINLNGCVLGDTKLPYSGNLNGMSFDIDITPVHNDIPDNGVVYVPIQFLIGAGVKTVSLPLVPSIVAQYVYRISADEPLTRYVYNPLYNTTSSPITRIKVTEADDFGVYQSANSLIPSNYIEGITDRTFGIQGALPDNVYLQCQYVKTNRNTLHLIAQTYYYTGNDGVLHPIPVSQLSFLLPLPANTSIEYNGETIKNSEGGSIQFVAIAPHYVHIPNGRKVFFDYEFVNKSSKIQSVFLDKTVQNGMNKYLNGRKARLTQIKSDDINHLQVFSNLTKKTEAPSGFVNNTYCGLGLYNRQGNLYKTIFKAHNNNILDVVFLNDIPTDSFLSNRASMSFSEIDVEQPEVRRWHYFDTATFKSELRKITPDGLIARPYWVRFYWLETVGQLPTSVSIGDYVHLRNLEGGFDGYIAKPTVDVQEIANDYGYARTTGSGDVWDRSGPVGAKLHLAGAVQALSYEDGVTKIELGHKIYTSASATGDAPGYNYVIDCSTNVAYHYTGDQNSYIELQGGYTLADNNYIGADVYALTAPDTWTLTGEVSLVDGSWIFLSNAVAPATPNPTYSALRIVLSTTVVEDYADLTTDDTLQPYPNQKIMQFAPKAAYQTAGKAVPLYPHLTKPNQILVGGLATNADVTAKLQSTHNEGVAFSHTSTRTLLIGSVSPFDTVRFTMRSVNDLYDGGSVANAITWEYLTSSGWSALDASNDLEAFTSSYLLSVDVDFTLPDDWTPLTFAPKDSSIAITDPSVTVQKLFWIRATYAEDIVDVHPVFVDIDITNDTELSDTEFVHFVRSVKLSDAQDPNININVRRNAVNPPVMTNMPDYPAYYRDVDQHIFIATSDDYVNNSVVIPREFYDIVPGSADDLNLDSTVLYPVLIADGDLPFPLAPDEYDTDKHLNHIDVAVSGVSLYFTEDDSGEVSLLGDVAGNENLENIDLSDNVALEDITISELSATGVNSFVVADVNDYGVYTAFYDNRYFVLLVGNSIPDIYTDDASPTNVNDIVNNYVLVYQSNSPIIDETNYDALGDRTLDKRIQDYLVNGISFGAERTAYGFQVIGVADDVDPAELSVAVGLSGTPDSYAILEVTAHNQHNVRWDAIVIYDYTIVSDIATIANVDLLDNRLLLSFDDGETLVDYDNRKYLLATITASDAHAAATEYIIQGTKTYSDIGKGNSIDDIATAITLSRDEYRLDQALVNTIGVDISDKTTQDLIDLPRFNIALKCANRLLDIVTVDPTETDAQIPAGIDLLNQGYHAFKIPLDDIQTFNPYMRDFSNTRFNLTSSGSTGSFGNEYDYCAKKVTSGLEATIDVPFYSYVVVANAVFADTTVNELFMGIRIGDFMYATDNTHADGLIGRVDNIVYPRDVDAAIVDLFDDGVSGSTVGNVLTFDAPIALGEIVATTLIGLTVFSEVDSPTINDHCTNPVYLGHIIDVTVDKDNNLLTVTLSDIGLGDASYVLDGSNPVGFDGILYIVGITDELTNDLGNSFRTLPSYPVLLDVHPGNEIEWYKQYISGEVIANAPLNNYLRNSYTPLDGDELYQMYWDNISGNSFIFNGDNITIADAATTTYIPFHSRSNFSLDGNISQPVLLSHTDYLNLSGSLVYAELTGKSSLFGENRMPAILLLGVVGNCELVGNSIAGYDFVIGLDQNYSFRTTEALTRYFDENTHVRLVFRKPKDALQKIIAIVKDSSNNVYGSRALTNEDVFLNNLTGKDAKDIDVIIFTQRIYTANNIGVGYSYYDFLPSTVNGKTFVPFRIRYNGFMDADILNNIRIAAAELYNVHDFETKGWSGINVGESIMKDPSHSSNTWNGFTISEGSRVGYFQIYTPPNSLNIFTGDGTNDALTLFEAMQIQPGMSVIVAANASGDEYTDSISNINTKYFDGHIRAVSFINQWEHIESDSYFADSSPERSNNPESHAYPDGAYMYMYVLLDEPATQSVTITDDIALSYHGIAPILKTLEDKAIARFDKISRYRNNLLLNEQIVYDLASRNVVERQNHARQLLRSYYSKGSILTDETALNAKFNDCPNVVYPEALHTFKFNAGGLDFSKLSVIGETVNELDDNGNLYYDQFFVIRHPSNAQLLLAVLPNVFGKVGHFNHTIAENGRVPLLYTCNKSKNGKEYSFYVSRAVGLLTFGNSNVSNNGLSVANALTFDRYIAPDDVTKYIQDAVNGVSTNALVQMLTSSSKASDNIRDLNSGDQTCIEAFDNIRKGGHGFTILEILPIHTVSNNPILNGSFTIDRFDFNMPQQHISNLQYVASMNDDGDDVDISHELFDSDGFYNINQETSLLQPGSYYPAVCLGDYKVHEIGQNISVETYYNHNIEALKAFLWSLAVYYNELLHKNTNNDYVQYLAENIPFEYFANTLHKNKEVYTELISVLTSGISSSNANYLIQQADKALEEADEDVPYGWGKEFATWLTLPNQQSLTPSLVNPEDEQVVEPVAVSVDYLTDQSGIEKRQGLGLNFGKTDMVFTESRGSSVSRYTSLALTDEWGNGSITKNEHGFSIFNESVPGAVPRFWGVAKALINSDGHIEFKTSKNNIRSYYSGSGFASDNLPLGNFVSNISDGDIVTFVGVRNASMMSSNNQNEFGDFVSYGRRKQYIGHFCAGAIKYNALENTKLLLKANPYDAINSTELYNSVTRICPPTGIYRGDANGYSDGKAQLDYLPCVVRRIAHSDVDLTYSNSGYGGRMEHIVVLPIGQEETQITDTPSTYIDLITTFQNYVKALEPGDLIFADHIDGPVCVGSVAYITPLKTNSTGDYPVVFHSYGQNDDTANTVPYAIGVIPGVGFDYICGNDLPAGIVGPEDVNPVALLQFCRLSDFSFTAPGISYSQYWDSLGYRQSRTQYDGLNAAIGADSDEQYYGEKPYDLAYITKDWNLICLSDKQYYKNVGGTGGMLDEYAVGDSATGYITDKNYSGYMINRVLDNNFTYHTIGTLSALGEHIKADDVSALSEKVFNRYENVYIATDSELSVTIRRYMFEHDLIDNNVWFAVWKKSDYVLHNIYYNWLHPRWTWQDNNGKPNELYVHHPSSLYSPTLLKPEAKDGTLTLGTIDAPFYINTQTDSLAINGAAELNATYQKVYTAPLDCEPIYPLDAVSWYDNPLYTETLKRSGMGYPLNRDYSQLLSLWNYNRVLEYFHSEYAWSNAGTVSDYNGNLWLKAQQQSFVPSWVEDVDIDVTSVPIAMTDVIYDTTAASFVVLTEDQYNAYKPKVGDVVVNPGNKIIVGRIGSIQYTTDPYVVVSPPAVLTPTYRLHFTGSTNWDDTLGGGSGLLYLYRPIQDYPYVHLGAVYMTYAPMSGSVIGDSFIDTGRIEQYHVGDAIYSANIDGSIPIDGTTHLSDYLRLLTPEQYIGLVVDVDTDADTVTLSMPSSGGSTDISAGIIVVGEQTWLSNISQGIHPIQFPDTSGKYSFLTLGNYLRSFDVTELVINDDIYAVDKMSNREMYLGRICAINPYNVERYGEAIVVGNEQVTYTHTANAQYGELILETGATAVIQQDIRGAFIVDTTNGNTLGKVVSYEIDDGGGSDYTYTIVVLADTSEIDQSRNYVNTIDVEIRTLKLTQADIVVEAPGVNTAQQIANNYNNSYWRNFEKPLFAAFGSLNVDTGLATATIYLVDNDDGKPLNDEADIFPFYQSVGGTLGSFVTNVAGSYLLNSYVTYNGMYLGYVDAVINNGSPITNMITVILPSDSPFIGITAETRGNFAFFDSNATYIPNLYSADVVIDKTRHHNGKYLLFVDSSVPYSKTAELQGVSDIAVGDTSIGSSSNTVVTVYLGTFDVPDKIAIKQYDDFGNSILASTPTIKYYDPRIEHPFDTSVQPLNYSLQSAATSDIDAVGSATVRFKRHLKDLPFSISTGNQFNLNNVDNYVIITPSHVPDWKASFNEDVVGAMFESFAERTERTYLCDAITGYHTETADGETRYRNLLIDLTERQHSSTTPFPLISQFGASWERFENNAWRSYGGYVAANDSEPATLTNLLNLQNNIWVEAPQWLDSTSDYAVTFGEDFDGTTSSIGADALIRIRQNSNYTNMYHWGYPMPRYWMTIELEIPSNKLNGFDPHKDIYIGYALKHDWYITDVVKNDTEDMLYVLTRGCVRNSGGLISSVEDRVFAIHNSGDISISYSDAVDQLVRVYDPLITQDASLDNEDVYKYNMAGGIQGLPAPRRGDFKINPDARSIRNAPTIGSDTDHGYRILTFSSANGIDGYCAKVNSLTSLSVSHVDDINTGKTFIATDETNALYVMAINARQGMSVKRYIVSKIETERSYSVSLDNTDFVGISSALVTALKLNNKLSDFRLVTGFTVLYDGGNYKFYISTKWCVVECVYDPTTNKFSVDILVTGIQNDLPTDFYKEYYDDFILTKTDADDMLESDARRAARNFVFSDMVEMVGDVLAPNTRNDLLNNVSLVYQTRAEKETYQPSGVFTLSGNEINLYRSTIGVKPKATTVIHGLNIESGSNVLQSNSLTLLKNISGQLYNESNDSVTMPQFWFTFDNVNANQIVFECDYSYLAGYLTKLQETGTTTSTIDDYTNLNTGSLINDHLLSVLGWIDIRFWYNGEWRRTNIADPDFYDDAITNGGTIGADNRNLYVQSLDGIYARATYADVETFDSTDTPSEIQTALGLLSSYNPFFDYENSTVQTENRASGARDIARVKVVLKLKPGFAMLLDENILPTPQTPFYYMLSDCDNEEEKATKKIALSTLPLIGDKPLFWLANGPLINSAVADQYLKVGYEGNDANLVGSIYASVSSTTDYSNATPYPPFVFRYLRRFYYEV